MNVITRNIPNAITCLNVAAGVMSIICATQGVLPLWGLTGLEWAYIFIGIAAIADFLDGFAARALHAYSNLGKELDSLCDLVSFGVAPAMIMYFTISECGTDLWMRWLTVLIPVCGAVRLARFNIDTRQSVNFIGLPIPANAIFWVGYSALALSGVEMMTQWYVLLPVLLVECWMMNSEVHLFSLKFKTWGWRENQWRWLLIATALVFTFCMGVGGLMWLIVAYVCYGLLDRTAK